MTNSFYNGNDGDDGLFLTGCFVAVADDIDAGEGAHTVVNADDTLGIVGYERKTVLYGVKACLATIGKPIFYLKVIFLT